MKNRIIFILSFILMSGLISSCNDEKKENTKIEKKIDHIKLVGKWKMLSVKLEMRKDKKYQEFDMKEKKMFFIFKKDGSYDSFVRGNKEATGKWMIEQDSLILDQKNDKRKISEIISYKNQKLTLYNRASKSKSVFLKINLK